VRADTSLEPTDRPLRRSGRVMQD